MVCNMCIFYVCVCVCEWVRKEARAEEGVVGVGELGEDEDGHGCFVCLCVCVCVMVRWRGRRAFE